MAFIRVNIGPEENGDKLSKYSSTHTLLFNLDLRVGVIVEYDYFWVLTFYFCQDELQRNKTFHIQAFSVHLYRYAIRKAYTGYNV